MNAVRVKSSGPIPKNTGLSLGRAQSGTALPTSPSRPLAVRLFPWMTALAALALVGNVVMYYRFSTLRPLVTVGSHTISKREYLAVLEEAAGKPILNKMVFDQLVRQAAAQAGVTPTAQDISQKITDIRTADPKMVSVPDDKLQEAAFSDLALENLRIQKIQVTDAEVARYYAAHSAGFQRDENLQVALIVTGNQTDAQTVSDLMHQNVSPSVIAKQPQFHVVGFNGYTIDLQHGTGKKILATLFAMKPGQEKSFAFDKQFLTARVFANRPKQVLPLREVRPQVARLAKLEKAPSVAAELTALYKADPPKFDIDKYQSFFEDIEKAAQNNTGTGLKP